MRNPELGSKTQNMSMQTLIINFISDIYGLYAGVRYRTTLLSAAYLPVLYE